MQDRPVLVTGHAIKRYAERILGIEINHVNEIGGELRTRCIRAIREVVQNGDRLEWPEALVFSRKYGRRVILSVSKLDKLAALVCSISDNEREKIMSSERYLHDNCVAVVKHGNTAVTLMRASNERLAVCEALRTMREGASSASTSEDQQAVGHSSIYFLVCGPTTTKERVINRLDRIGWLSARLYLEPGLERLCSDYVADAAIRLSEKEMSATEQALFFRRVIHESEERDVIFICGSSFASNGIMRLRIASGRRGGRTHTKSNKIYRLNRTDHQPVSENL